MYQGGPIAGTDAFGNGFGSSHRVQFGPTVNVHITPAFYLGVSGGYRTTTPTNGIGTGYARIEFLVLSNLGG